MRKNKQNKQERARAQRGSGEKDEKRKEMDGKLTSTVTLSDVALTPGKFGLVVHLELLLVPHLSREITKRESFF